MVTHALLESLGNFLSQPELFYMLFLGTFLGLIFGALPGLSSVTGMALVLPFTFGMDPLGAMLVYAGIISVAPLGGSLPAILLNTPGTGGNAATCFDGFPLTRQGQGERAITISAICCLFGTLFGVVVLLLLLQLIIPIVLAFRAPEIFWLILLGLTVISFVVRESVFKGLAAGGLGILLSLIGFNEMFATTLFAGDSIYLWDGVPLIPFYIGIFALSEVIVYTAKGGTISPKTDFHKKTTRWGQISGGVWDVIKRPITVIRSAVIGTSVGIVPGVGGSVAAFISYATAKQTSKSPELFGHGSIEGIIACEVANDAKEGGSLLPTVAFGIPGSADMAIVLGAFILHGLEPGPLLMRDHLDVVMTLALGICFSQIIGSGVVLFTANYLARLVTIKTRYLAPVIIVLCFGGAFSIRSNIWDVFFCVGSGLFGYFMKRYRFPVIPLAIGYILGNMAEKSFHQSLMMNYGSYTVFFSSPICITLSVLTLLVIFSPLIKKIKKKNKNLEKR